MVAEMMEKRRRIGSRLSIARERAGLSQSQVAAEMDLHRPSISQIEAGRRAVAAEELAKFAGIYSVDIKWLAGVSDLKGTTPMVAEMKMKEKRRRIGYRLSIARERAALSQFQVAVEMDLPRPSISEIETGRRRVAAEELARFAEIYSVDIKWLAEVGEDKADPLRDKLQLAARSVANLKYEGLEKVIDLQPY